MRFGPVFSALPETVPKNLYQEQTVRDRRPRPCETPNVDQQSLVRSIAKLLPSEFWHDANIFPQKDEVLLSLSQMTEDSSFVSGWLDSNFSCLPIDGGEGVALFNKSGRCLATGTSGEVFHYVASYCKAAMPSLITLHRFGFVKHVNLTGVLADDLQAFRTARNFSAGLDRLSKIDELALIDQDSTVNKFPIDDYVQHGTCYHFGAGTNTSSSQRRLRMLYDKVVLIDPRLKEGVDSHCTTWEEMIKKVPPDADIVSDVAYGDDDGVVIGDSKKLVETLYGMADSRMVVVKYPLHPGINAKGIVLAKPRPHNMEIIVLLTSEGEPLDSIYKAEYPKVVKANQLRNAAVFVHRFNSRIKGLYNTSEEIRDYILSMPPDLPRPASVIRTPKRSRNRELAAGAASGGRADRHPAWYKAVKDPDFNFDGPAVLLPPANMQRGSFGILDPGLPDIGASMRSVKLSATAAGFDVAFQNGQWRVI